MPEQEARFNCANCGAPYEVVRVEAPTTADGEIACLSCGVPLEAREGRFVLKYFLVGRAVTPNRRAR
jgi:DNA-directed RNA polymerase subunit RPC12/RpoP